MVDRHIRVGRHIGTMEDRCDTLRSADAAVEVTGRVLSERGSGSQWCGSIYDGGAGATTTVGGRRWELSESNHHLTPDKTG